MASSFIKLTTNGLIFAGFEMGGWGCPHEVDGKCQKVLNRPCDIGMKGCVLAGRFRFADPSKNRPRNTPLNQAAETAASDDSPS